MGRPFEPIEEPDEIFRPIGLHVNGEKSPSPRHRSGPRRLRLRFAQRFYAVLIHVGRESRAV